MATRNRLPANSLGFIRAHVANSALVADLPITEDTPIVPGPLPAPTALIATVLSDTEIDLTWTSTNGTFDVYRGTTSGALSFLTSVVTTSFSDTGLTDSTEYFYHVIATGANDSVPSSEVSAFTWGVMELTTTWDDASGADGELTFVWTTVSSKTDVQWSIAGVPFSTTDILTVPADSGNLDGTAKIIKLVTPSLRDTDDIVLQRLWLKIMDIRGLNGATLTKGFDFRGSGAAPRQRIESVVWPANLTITSQVNEQGLFMNEAFLAPFTTLDMSTVLLDDVTGWTIVSGSSITTFIGPKVGSTMLGTGTGNGVMDFSTNQDLVTEFDFSNLDMEGQAVLKVNNNALLANLIFKSTTSGGGLTIFSGQACVLGHTNLVDVMNWTDGVFVSIALQTNAMVVAEVNEYLVEFAVQVAALGTSSGSILIAGTNAAPDGSSGGFDGLTAKTDMIAAGLTITTS